MQVANQLADVNLDKMILIPGGKFKWVRTSFTPKKSRFIK